MALAATGGVSVCVGSHGLFLPVLDMVLIQVKFCAAGLRHNPFQVEDVITSNNKRVLGALWWPKAKVSLLGLGVRDAHPFFSPVSAGSTVLPSSPGIPCCGTLTFRNRLVVPKNAESTYQPAKISGFRFFDHLSPTGV